MIGCLDCMALKDSIEDKTEYCISPNKPCEQVKIKKKNDTYYYGEVIIL
ncbi:hypothetical protein [Acidaminobacter sp. JC074]|nr:hypothetical protein [Acidaminobacter sp. JC074]